MNPILPLTPAYVALHYAAIDPEAICCANRLLLSAWTGRQAIVTQHALLVATCGKYADVVGLLDAYRAAGWNVTEFRDTLDDTAIKYRFTPRDL